MSVNRLSLGTAQLGLAYGVGNQGIAPELKVVDAILSEAVNAQIQWLDTAVVYGEAESRIGVFLQRRELPDNTFRICTKLPELASCPDDIDLAGHIESAVDASLIRLGMQTIDEYLIHDVADLDRWGRRLVDALCELKVRGKIQRLGLSVYEPGQLHYFQEYPEFTVVQHPLNMFDLRFLAGDTLLAAQHQGLLVQVRSIFLQGLFSLDVEDLPSRVTHAREALLSLHELLSQWGLHPIDIALPFVLSTTADRVVIGVDTPEQLRRNIQTINQPVPPGLGSALMTRFEALPDKIFDPRCW